MNRVFVVKEKDELNSSMTRCYTGVMSNLGPLHTTFNQNCDARKFIESFVRKHGNFFKGMSVDATLKGFVNYLQVIKLEDLEESENEIENEPITSRFDLLDL